MKTHARVVVIGGGVVGAGTLYHLARKGWSDVVLVERRELTSGSTWHAAGLLPLFNMSYSVGQIHKSSVELYRTLEEETGQNVGLRLAEWMVEGEPGIDMLGVDPRRFGDGACAVRDPGDGLDAGGEVLPDGDGAVHRVRGAGVRSGAVRALELRGTSSVATPCIGGWSGGSRTGW